MFSFLLLVFVFGIAIQTQKYNFENEYACAQQKLLPLQRCHNDGPNGNAVTGNAQAKQIFNPQREFREGKRNTSSVGNKTCVTKQEKTQKKDASAQNDKCNVFAFCREKPKRCRGFRRGIIKGFRDGFSAITKKKHTKIDSNSEP